MLNARFAVVGLLVASAAGCTDTRKVTPRADASDRDVAVYGDAPSQDAGPGPDGARPIDGQVAGADATISNDAGE